VTDAIDRKKDRIRPRRERGKAVAALSKSSIVMQQVRSLFLCQLPEFGNLLGPASDVEKRLTAEITLWPDVLLCIRETEGACFREELRCHDFTAQYVRVLPKRGRPFDPPEN